MSDFYALAFEKTGHGYGKLANISLGFLIHTRCSIIYSKLKRYQINYLFPKKTLKLLCFELLY